MRKWVTNEFQCDCLTLNNRLLFPSIEINNDPVNNSITLEKEIAQILTCNRVSQHVPIHWLKVDLFSILLSVLKLYIQVVCYLGRQPILWHSWWDGNLVNSATKRKSKGSGSLRMQMEKRQRRGQTQKLQRQCHFRWRRNKCHDSVHYFHRITCSRSGHWN